MNRRRPAVRICIPFTIGIVAGWFLFRHTGFTSHLVAGAVLMLAYAMVPHILRHTCLFALLVVSGSLMLTMRTSRDAGKDLVPIAEAHGDTVECSGVVVQKPVRKSGGSVMLVDVDSIVTRIAGLGYPCRLRVSVRERDLTVSALGHGARVHLRGELRRPPGPRNPGEFDYASYCILHGIDALLFVKSPTDLKLLGRDSSFSFIGIIAGLRESVGRDLERYASPIVAGLLKGLVIGERSELPEEVRMAFTNAGLMHLLAVSGFNVGLVAGILLAIGSLLRLPRGLRTAVTAAGLVVFMYLTGAEASVVRATIMALAYLGAGMVDRSPDLLNTLAVAALMALCLDPRTFFDIGFQLSFAAVLALAVVVPFVQAIADRLPSRLRENISFRYVAGSLVVSLAASAGTIPITAFYFHKISLIGVLLNLAAVPISGILLGIGFLIAAFGPIAPWVCQIYAEAAEFLGAILLKLTMWGGTRTFASLDVGVGAIGMIGMYLLIIFIIEWQRRLVRSVAVILVLVLCNVQMWKAVIAPSNVSLRVSAIDVGQGDAILITTPAGRNLLVDTGPRSFSYDAGARTVLPFLEHEGIGCIDEIVLTHSHADHTGGAPALLRNIRVRNILLPVASGKHGILAEINQLRDSLGCQVTSVDTSFLMMDLAGVRMYVLHASRMEDDSTGEAYANQNDNSIVVRIVFGETSLLLMGDAEEATERNLVVAFGDFLKSDIIKIGHHGSATSTFPQFLETVKPGCAIISVGTKNKFGHPSPETVRRLDDFGITTLRTDEQGAIIMESDGKSWIVVDWR